MTLMLPGWLTTPGARCMRTSIHTRSEHTGVRSHASCFLPSTSLSADGRTTGRAGRGGKATTGRLGSGQRHKMELIEASIFCCLEAATGSEMEAWRSSLISALQLLPLLRLGSRSASASSCFPAHFTFSVGASRRPTDGAHLRASDCISF